MVRRLKPRRGQSMSWMIVVVVAIALVIAVVVVIYTRAMGAMNAIATLTGSGVVSGDSLTITVAASGGTVKIMGIVLLNSKGVVTAIGTTPGYVGSFYQTCRLSGVYINGASGPLTPPWVLQNGQSASFIFTEQSSSSIKIIASPGFRMARGRGYPSPNPPSTSSDCASVSQAIIFYNTGKTAIIPIIG